MPELTVSGNEITDVVRLARVEGDGILAPDSSFGIWEATENLVPNGGLESGTVGWAGGGTNTIESSTDQAKFGASSNKTTFVDNANLTQFSNLTLTAAEKK